MKKKDLLRFIQKSMCFFVMSTILHLSGVGLTMATIRPHTNTHCSFHRMPLHHHFCHKAAWSNDLGK